MSARQLDPAARFRVVILLSTSVAALLAPAASGEPASGFLTGRVEDIASGKSLPYTNISFSRVSAGTTGSVDAGGVLCDQNGRFVSAVVPGTYRLECRYISYQKLVLENVEVRSGETTHVEPRLTLAAVRVEAVKVTAARLKDKETSLLDQQKKSDVISDAIGAEQISRSTDSNAAEAVERVSGTTVEEGKYVYVRGLGDRYSAALVNGTNVGSPESNKRVLPLDIFPTGVLDNIVIQKTYTPDMDGEFGGGVVNINTKQNLDRRVVESSLSLGMTKTDGSGAFLGYTGGRFDFLGVDDGTRALPDRVQELAGGRRVTRNDFSVEERAQMGGSFKSVWTPKDEGLKPSFRYSGLYADRLSLGGRPLGFLLSLSLSNGFEALSKTHNSYELGSQEGTPKFLYDVQESASNVLAGITSSVDYRPSERNEFKANVVYTRDTEDRTWVSQGPNNDFGNESVLQRQLGYVERSVLSTSVRGDHKIWYEGAKLDWLLSYSEGTRNELDRRLSIYEWNPVNQRHELSRRFSSPLTRIFGESDEYDRTLKVDWLLPAPSAGALDPDFKIGFASAYRNRESWYRRFGFAPRSNLAGERNLLPEELVTQANLDAGYVLFEELTLPNDSWSAYQFLTAFYGMLDTRLYETLRLVAGARFEQSTQNVLTGSPYASNAPPEAVQLASSDMLPAANLTWNMTRRQNFRLGWSRTLNRPRLRELSPFDMFNYEDFYTEAGNPELQNAELTSYDLRWEMYPSPREYLGFSLFRKDMDRPIQTILYSRVTGEALVPGNGNTGRLEGAELEARAGLDRLPQLLGAGQPSALRYWAFGVNYSRVNSLVQYDGFEAPLTGQSSFALNAGLFYASTRFNSNLLYKTAGKRLHAFTLGVLPDIYAYPMQSLDYTMGYKLGLSTFRLQIENLLNEPLEYRQGDLVVRRWWPGRSVSLSYRYAI